MECTIKGCRNLQTTCVSCGRIVCTSILPEREDKYLLFMGSDYYPEGRWEDFNGFFDSLDECISFFKLRDDDCLWAHVVYKDQIILEAKGFEMYLENEEKFTRSFRWEIELFLS